MEVEEYRTAQGYQTPTSLDSSSPRSNIAFPIRSNSVSSASSSTSSLRSNYSTKSSLRYIGFSENTAKGFQEFMGLKKACFGSGWNLSKYQLLKSYMLVSKYYNQVRQQYVLFSSNSHAKSALGTSCYGSQAIGNCGLFCSF